MFNLLFALLPSLPGNRVDVSAEAVHQQIETDGKAVHLSQDVYDDLVSWNEHDALRADVSIRELNEGSRLRSLLQSIVVPLKVTRDEQCRGAIFSVEYFDRTKKGNPRRARLALRHITTDKIVVEFA